MNDPYPAFTEAMFGIYRRTLSEAHYNASHFHEMLVERFGYDTALYLVLTPAPSTGFAKLYDLKRLDLTVEAIVLRPQWKGLFQPSILNAAYDRLSQFQYQFPADSWRPGELAAIVTPAATDLGDVSPDRIESTTYRILRDTQLSRRIKALHQFRCQLCGHTITLPDGSLYSEAHHIRPLGAPHNGPDVAGNIICVCPNHHTELDYLVTTLVPSNIRAVAGHAIEAQFIEYHNDLKAKAAKSA